MAHERIRNATLTWNDASRSVGHMIASLSGRIATVGLGAALAVGPADAQDTTRARVDSLLARLERTEERVKLLEQQLATEAQSAVRTRSRMGMEVRGRVIVNAFTNGRRVNSTGGAAFVLPDDPGQLDPRGLAMSIRQTSVGLAVSATDILGATFLGDVEVDFHGGQLPSSGGRTFPLLRMRTARAQLNWRRTELLLGQESPLMAGVSPVSLAAIGSPLFAASGNLWLWLPQARLSVETTGDLRFGIQGAVLAPGSAAPVGSFEVSEFDVAERSRRPFLQTRVRARWGGDESAGEIGLGAHSGWYSTARDSLDRGYALAVDLVWPVTSWIEVRGEAYDGKGMRSLGGGGIGQLFGFDGRIIRSRGGWAQLNVHQGQPLTFGVGMGMDDPNDTDLAATARLKNAVTSAHVHWRPAGPLLFGLEYRKMRTTYATRSFTNDHLNLAFGFEF